MTDKPKTVKVRGLASSPGNAEKYATGFVLALWVCFGFYMLLRGLRGFFS